MPDLIDEISRTDREELARKTRVAAHNTSIFASLKVELGKRIDKYNQQHTQGTFQPRALLLKAERTSATEFSGELEKTTQPQSSLKVTFPINSGSMILQRSSSGNDSRTIVLDYENDVPVFRVGPDVYSVEGIADYLLQLVLFPQRPLPGIQPTLSELQLAFEVARKDHEHWTTGGKCEPHSNTWEEVTARYQSARDSYDFALRHAEISKAQTGKPISKQSAQSFETAFSVFTVCGRPLGEGGNGRVYDVVDQDGVAWAIKALHPNASTGEKLRRFKNEIAFLARVKHPNIVDVVDWGFSDITGTRQPFYVMPKFSSTLRVQMKAGIAPDEVWSYFDQLLAGLEAAHSMAVWHRDLKPENLLYDPTRRLLAVADFGIAHIAEDLLRNIVNTSESDRLANFQYAAPEQRAFAEVNHRADIYSLGLILNEMFTGEIRQGAGHKTIGSVAPRFAPLDGVVERMVQQNPLQRIPSVADVRTLLNSALFGENAARGVIAIPVRAEPSQIQTEPGTPQTNHLPQSTLLENNYQKDGITLNGPDGMEFLVYPSTGRYLCKILNGSPSIIKYFRITVTDSRTFDVARLIWRDQVPFHGEMGPAPATNPGDYSREFIFGTPQGERFRIGENSDSLLHWPTGDRASIHRWRMSIKIHWSSGTSKEVWPIDLCFRRDPSINTIDFMEYKQSIPLVNF